MHRRLDLVGNLFGRDATETPGERIFFRVFELFVAVASLYLAWTWGFYTLRISDVVLPLGIARFVDISFMLENELPLWNAALISALIAVGFSHRMPAARYAYAAAFLLLLVQYGARYSLGEIPHSANILGMTFLGLGLGMLFFRPGPEMRRFVLGFTYFFIGLGYTLAAWSKLVARGPFWVDGRHLWMWINEKGVDQMAKTGLLEFNWLQSLLLEHYALATIFLSIGLLTEFLAFLLWWRRFRVPVMLAIIALHLGIFYTMNILFSLSVYQLVLLALPWPAWIDTLLASRIGSAIRTRIALEPGAAHA